MNRRRGFTLIELIVVVAIIGILAAIAYPQYTQFLKKGNRAAAQSVLMDIANKEQFFLSSQRQYTADYTTDLAVTPSDNVAKFYTITMVTTAGPPPTFVITATPNAGTIQASDPALTLDSAGTKTPASLW